MHLIHDLRLVLLSIAACLATLRDAREPLAPEVEQARRLLETGLAVTDELLVSHVQPAVPFVEVNALLEELDGAITTIVGPSVTVETRLGALDSRVYAQRLDIERILLNLVFNAAAAMPAGGTLTIETQSENNDKSAIDSHGPYGLLRLTVRDTGRGMSDAQLQRVIDPMAPPRMDGSGLGLACVALILTRLGGTFSIDCAHQPGTLVTVTLPLSPNGMRHVH